MKSTLKTLALCLVESTLIQYSSMLYKIDTPKHFSWKRGIPLWNILIGWKIQNRFFIFSSTNWVGSNLRDDQYSTDLLLNWHGCGLKENSNTREKRE